MVTKTAYKIIKKAVILRLARKEELETILDSYPKLSEEQRAQMIAELKEEGYITEPSED